MKWYKAKENVYYYDYRGAIPLNKVFGGKFPESYLNVCKFIIILGRNRFILIEPPDPDLYDFTDPEDVINYLHAYREETPSRTYVFSSIEELKAVLEARGVEPPKSI